MDYSIRPLTQEDEPFLWQMLYEAAHMVEEGNLTVPDVLRPFWIGVTTNYCLEQVS
ncbi:hypothetical protein PQG02_06435 [Nostoc sp. UHCC 0926]|uniref:hypothetical protein n=1 Tax=unclassified Nostoc TaxID=2593658 RepID=UPI002360945C|nr:hypothetical protein [Nostoc sp. UHCC 0926]WDD33990.1 hypothetical protein PQG02_06435 [Nostoc sp. UHCC 0926]